MIWKVLFVLFGFLVVFIIFPWLMRTLLRKKFLADIKKSRSVCLTFDDGPNPNSTPKILKLLEEAGVKATFFVLGENVKKYPHLTLQIIDMGHEIGEHSYRHIHPWKCVPFHSLIDLIRGTQTIKRHLSSDRPIFLRPPYGKLNLITLLYILFSQKRLAFWHINSRDYELESADLVVKQVMDQIFPGSVILFHDGRLNSSSSPDLTVSAVTSILKETADRGLSLSTVAESLKKASKK